jgi:hypothetical protein
MDFQVHVTLPNYPFNIAHKDAVMSIGSCFSENIGHHLQHAGFKVAINPFGILFNPLSICNALERIVSKKYFQRDELVEHNGVWYSFHHHGKFYASSADELLNSINAALDEAHTFLKQSKVLLITLGSSWVYSYNATGEVVANCHKIPNHQFSKRMLSVGEVSNSLQKIHLQLQQFNPELKVVFTVSPVRYWKDGAHENSLSKATLHLAVASVLEKNQSCYFPAYELVIDELRDYRFYKEDMLHPNDLAVKFVWQKFSEAFFSEETRQIANRVGRFRAMEQHRPINNSSSEMELFLKKLEEERNWLQSIGLF